MSIDDAFYVLNLANDGTTSAEGLAERCPSMMSSMPWNLVDDGTTLAEGLAERCRSMMSSMLWNLADDGTTPS